MINFIHDCPLGSLKLECAGFYTPLSYMSETTPTGGGGGGGGGSSVRRARDSWSGGS